MSKPKFTKGPISVTELAVLLNDWTGTRFILHAPDAPGGTAAIIGGLGEGEERANADLYAASTDLYKACEAQHEAIDRLFARIVHLDNTFRPSKCGQPWEALVQGNAALAKAVKK